MFCVVSCLLGGNGEQTRLIRFQREENSEIKFCASSTCLSKIDRVMIIVPYKRETIGIFFFVDYILDLRNQFFFFF